MIENVDIPYARTTQRVSNIRQIYICVAFAHHLPPIPSHLHNNNNILPINTYRETLNKALIQALIKWIVLGKSVYFVHLAPAPPPYQDLESIRSK